LFGNLNVGSQSLAVRKHERIRVSYRRWTDYDEDDPSILLVELFAYLIDRAYHHENTNAGEALLSILETQRVLKRDEMVKRMKEGKTELGAMRSKVATFFLSIDLGSIRRYCYQSSWELLLLDVKADRSPRWIRDICSGLCYRMLSNEQTRYTSSSPIPPYRTIAQHHSTV
jgi:hypothetical protein